MQYGNAFCPYWSKRQLRTHPRRTKRRFLTNNTFSNIMIRFLDSMGMPKKMYKSPKEEDVSEKLMTKEKRLSVG